MSQHSVTLSKAMGVKRILNVDFILLVSLGLGI